MGWLPRIGLRRRGSASLATLLTLLVVLAPSLDPLVMGPVPLVVEVRSKDDQPIQAALSCRLSQVDSATGRMESPYVSPLLSRQTEQQVGVWVQPGSEVHLAVLCPPHGLVETSLICPHHQVPSPVLLELPEPNEIAIMKLSIEEVQLASEHDSHGDTHRIPGLWHGDNFVSILSPKSRVRVKRVSLREAQEGVPLPRGDYVVRLQGVIPGMCAHGPASTEDYVPIEVPLHLDRDRVISMSPVRGAGLVLHATEPEQFPQRSAYRDLRAYLIDRDGREIDLTWGYERQSLAIPRPSFPIGRKAWQIVPVPVGVYDLCVVGKGIQPIQQRVELRSKPTILTRSILELSPVPARLPLRKRR